MADDKGQDEKILCVPTADPNYNHWNDTDQVPPHTKEEIEHFFRVYKEMPRALWEVGFQLPKEKIVDALDRYLHEKLL